MEHPIATLRHGGMLGQSRPHSSRNPSSSSVTSVCFVAQRQQSFTSSDNDNDNDSDSDTSSTTSKDDSSSCSSSSFEDFQEDVDNLLLPGSIPGTSSCLPPSGLMVAGCDVEGYGRLWNVMTRRVVALFGVPAGDSSLSTLYRNENVISGPGLAVCRFSHEYHEHWSTQPKELGVAEGVTGGCGRFLYQTRATLTGQGGTVSLHDIHHQSSPSSTSVKSGSIPLLPPLYQTETHSPTFCKAATCHGHPHLFVTPVGGLGLSQGFARVYDVRVKPSTKGILTLHGAHGIPSSSSSHWNKHDKNYGMLTSVSMMNCASSRIVVACGMESGHVFFHDCASTSTASKTPLNTLREPLSSPIPSSSCHVKISRDPVLTLDLAPSTTKNKDKHTKTSGGAVLAVAGCAGDVHDQANMTDKEQGTVCILKAVFSDETLEGSKSKSNSKSNSNCKSQAQEEGEEGEEAEEAEAPSSARAWLRSRLHTQTPSSTPPSSSLSSSYILKKPGVNSIAFSHHAPNHNTTAHTTMFAVGGWDKRVRIYNRQGVPLAILGRSCVESRVYGGGYGGGHGGGGGTTQFGGSVTCLDWSPSPSSSSKSAGGHVEDEAEKKHVYLATASEDGHVRIWHVDPALFKNSKGIGMKHA